ncbi:MAG: EAL domain-containing protein, partial [Gammaproteobacteria bacterium]|nr:EAL domain-containing protein [Gammaproteobacteria bacterium]NIR83884.1 EAL domain-containing protein [Gammaproteobacteria bacterium]NIU05194.1 EAL domain-containing protein [Gammaproteobacteria bacterium]NIV52042.1 EAL domain-containing protein [Gammaproteobacteria bacterium]NIX86467.1 EAL domain-containing protein [Gammaproteobacteria bacterium]
NRALARDRLERAIANAQPEGQRVALVLLDLDRFKDVNDSLGHVAGDALIREAAARLKACVRDIDTVARMGSDEFALILEGISDVVDIDDLAAGVLSAFTDPFLLGDHNVVTPVSMGITVYPDDGSSSRELLVNAEAAMANAKESGGGVYRFFTADITARIRSRMTLEQELRRALEREEFVLHYQPIVDLRTRAVEAVEALVRWHHPTRGLVGPGEFIPLMEETGLIKPLGACILRSVCAQGRAWQSRYLRTPRISINVSASQFADPGFVDTVLGNLGACCLDNGIIEFEITESVFMHNLDTIHETLEALAGLGVSLALDDFGTGYSALSYLTRFPIDTLKIDRSFVRDLSADSDHAAIVTAVIAMARSLRLNVVAEGVEAQEELDFLRDRGCQLAQGELIAAPQPVVMLDRLLERGVPELLEPLVPREGAE